MRYNKHRLFIEKVNAQSIAKKIDTPFYCYSFNKLKTNINNFKKNFNKIDPLICFSVKSNNNLYILRIIKRFGLGADVVSKGELLRALKNLYEFLRTHMNSLGCLRIFLRIPKNSSKNL